ncbi:helix-turn-helix transcriptional regulator [Serratia sp. JSRIV001]|uniref:helix-turn-helix domain-containing protein n=1 Tax=unclassified Serratia (in: enterobacteria) TaxID=2647522 RepID=UPI001CBCC9DB|nr:MULTISPECIES: helix-turn-helix transcriptional regulator [unclassified Serratia (in: enterobacteria)]UAN47035.1 helix-turn-helix transcriptional regulator [Serratia sp. JSRIV001]UAN57289.1 helix-turn-helix transcriptional regulator [Serratia sp. JSRIV004]
MNKTDSTAKDRKRFISMPGINRFSERLKIAMGAMTNVALANVCGISESAVRSYLKGRSYPGIDKIQAIAQACSAPMEWLITGDVEADKNDSIAIYYDSKLMGVIEVMTDEQRQQLAQVIVQHGISGIMRALQSIESIAEFSLLPENERLQLMQLHGEIKKGAPEDSKTNELNLPVHKQAG